MLGRISRVQLCYPTTRLLCPWGFSRQEHRRGLPCPPPGDLSNPGIEPAPLRSPALAGRFFTTGASWEAPREDALPKSLLLLIACETHCRRLAFGTVRYPLHLLWFCLFLTVPGLSQHTRSSVASVFSSCGPWAWLPDGMWDLSSLTKDRTHVPCIGRQILNHWTTSEVLQVF